MKTHWVGAEEDIDKLNMLLGEKYIGVDSEWRPQLTYYHNSRPALLQLSSRTDVFLVDLFNLSRVKALDDILSQIFADKRTTIIGFGFDADIEMFTRKLYRMRFIKYIRNFIDA